MWTQNLLEILLRFSSGYQQVSVILIVHIKKEKNFNLKTVLSEKQLKVQNKQN